MLPVLHRENGSAAVVHDPFDDFERITRDLWSWANRWNAGLLDGVEAPLSDLEETDDAFIVDVDVPGVAKGDVDIQLEGRRLIVTAERKERERVGMLRRRTRRVGTYRFEMVIPADIDDQHVDASLRDGVLTIRLPKADHARRRRISVN